MADKVIKKEEPSSPPVRIGDMVIYARQDRRGTKRPAMVVFAGSGGVHNLLVFLDGKNDTPYENSVPMEWVVSVKYDAKGAPGTWSRR